MSEVLLGYDLSEPRFVALKFLRGAFRFDNSAIGRLKREAEIYRNLQHPSIVRLVGTGLVQGGGAFLAQEFLRGFSLSESMREGGLPDLHMVMILLEDLCSALHTAHRAGVIHRDIQPQNIMVGPDGRATIFDFGIAYAADDLVRTEVGTVMGTIIYSSPEQRRGEKVDHRSDIFGVGAVLYEMLTGRKAIEARTFEQALSATTAALPRPSQVNPRVPAILDGICMRLLHDDPDRRYQDLREVLIEVGKLRIEAPEEVAQVLFGTREMRRIDEGISAMREGKMAVARQVAAEFETRTPEGMESEVHYLVGLIHLSDGRPDLAGKSFERALYHDDNLDVTLDFAMMLLRQGDLDRAATLLDRVSGAFRGNLLVLGLLDTIEQLRRAPPEVLAHVGNKAKKEANLFGSLRSFFKRGG